jgi:hypothetical protein
LTPVHALQVPQVPTPQQCPSVQWPLWHWLSSEQVAPLPATHMPLWHVRPTPHGTPVVPHEQLDM